MPHPEIPHLVLASGSPRRRELLAAMEIPYRVEPSRVDESTIGADHPRTFALRAAYAKALDVAARQEPDTLVLAADTVVAFGLTLYGKPVDDAHAKQMLGELSGKTHDVITGVALARAGSAEVALHSATTRVLFRNLTAAEISAYVATGEPRDKAGGYGIQGQGAGLIEAIDGDYWNVVGLPCEVLCGLLDDAVGTPLGINIPPTPARWA